MQVSRFEIEAGHPADERKEPRHDAEPRATMQASGDAEDEDQRGDETPEEPGYGHGV